MGDAAPGAFSFVGSAAAPEPPAGTKVVVLWTVSRGSSDYVFAFGGGTTSGSDVYVSFSTTPPGEALNGGKLGVALVALVGANVDVPEGKASKELIDSITALSVNHSIVFRNGTDSAIENGWDLSFPQGFSCGRCEHHDSGFDTFVVDDCANVTLVPTSQNPKGCNWT